MKITKKAKPIPNEQEAKDLGIPVQNNAEETSEETEKTAEIITNVHPFSLDKLLMNGRGDWEMHVTIQRTLNLIHHSYNLTLVVNFDSVNEQLEKARERFDDAQMNMDGSTDAEEHYQALLDAKEELKNNCPDIPLVAAVKQTKYVSGDTAIVFQISPEIINQFNNHRNYLPHYKIKMEPIIA